MDNRKLGQLIVSVVAIVWIFCMSFLISMKVAKSQREKTTTLPVVTQQQQHTTAPQLAVTTKPVTTMPRQEGVGNHFSVQVSVGDPEWLIAEQESSKKAEEEAAKNTTAKKVTTTKPKSNVPEGKREIINSYINGVNQLKRGQNYSLYKDDKLNVTIDNLPNIPGAQSVADSFLSANQKEPITYNFAGGVDSTTGLTPNNVVAPLNVDAAVNESAVSSATAEPMSGGGFKVTLMLEPETQTYTTPAMNHSTMVEVVDVAPLIPSGVTVTRLEMRYTDTKIEAVFNKDGKITSMVHYMKVEKAEVDIKALAFNVSVNIHGDFTSSYTITY